MSQYLGLSGRTSTAYVWPECGLGNRSISGASKESKMRSQTTKTQNDCMRVALRLARRGYGTTSPNPMVGAVLVKNGKIIGRGWHQRAGGPHAEIAAIRDAKSHGTS